MNLPNCLRSFVACTLQGSDILATKVWFYRSTGLRESPASRQRKKSGAPCCRLLFKWQQEPRPKGDWLCSGVSDSMSVFPLLSLKALLREPARCLHAFHLLRVASESPVWPVSRFLCSQLCDVVACLRQCRAKRWPCHAPIAQFKWKLDELLGSDPAIQNN